MTQTPLALTVTQLTHAIKMALEAGFVNVAVQGEISNCKCQTSGHWYFTLKDEQAQISAVMFRGDAQALSFSPKDGSHVMVCGDLNVYPPSGKYQVVVKSMQLVGMGALLLKLEELKQKIHKKGWFRKEHKKPLPKFPKVIGVVTSPTGAAIQDILNILTRRFSGFRLILNPVKVQGEGSAQEIAQAIKQFNDYDLVDVMIVGRGGGSIEDLWAFNEEIVAEAIFLSKIPIISAVGHEIDHCIADYVADVRAPTPSAAAEIVIAEKSAQLHHLVQIKQRLQQTVFHLIRQDRRRLEGILKLPMISSATRLLGPWMQRVDSLRNDIDATMSKQLNTSRLRLQGCVQELRGLRPSNQIQHFRQKLVHYERGIMQSLHHRLTFLNTWLERKTHAIDHAWAIKQSERANLLDADRRKQTLDEFIVRFVLVKKNKLEGIVDLLHAIDPKNLLLKGYSILFSEKDHSVINSVKALRKNQDIRLMFSDGEALSTIKDIFPK